MRLLPILLTAAFACTLAQGRVAVSVGHWLQPLLNQSEEAFVLENRDIVFQLKCSAPYPTEWVYDDDDQHPNAVRRLRVEWTDRKFQRSIDEREYSYIAWIQLQYSRVLEKEVLICRSVADHQDKVRVQLQPNNNYEVQITMAPHVKQNDVNVSGSSVDDFAVPAIRTKPVGESEHGCDASFSVISTYNGVFWKCEMNYGESLSRAVAVADLAFHECRPSAAHCANTFRVIKQLDKCVTDFSGNEPPVPLAEIEQTWTRMPADRVGIPGVAVCGPKYKSEEGVELRRAVQYYFEPADLTDPRFTVPEIHFVWPPIPHRPQDLIQFQPSAGITKSVYYTDELIHVTCTVPKYGFSFDPVFTVSVNGSRVLLEREFVEDYVKSVYWTKTVTVHFANYGPGEYELSCIAPVWNTTEWANQTRTINVFESKHIGNSLQSGQQEIVDKLDNIALSVLTFAKAEGEHYKSIHAMLEKLVTQQEKHIAIAEQVLAAVSRSHVIKGPLQGATTATGPIPVAEIKNQLQSGRIAI